MDSQDQKREAFLDALGEVAHSVTKLSDVLDSLSKEDRCEIESLDWEEVLNGRKVSIHKIPSEFFAFIDQLSAIWGV